VVVGLIFAFLTYMAKEKNAKNKTNTDPNATTNLTLNPQSTIASERKGLN